MGYKQIQQENVFIYGGTLATFCGFSEGTDIGISKIRYEVRAGKKGKGRILAKVNCVFGYKSQFDAIWKLKKKLGCSLLHRRIMKLIIQDNIGSMSVGEVAISTDEMKELVSWLESRGCNIGATQQSVQRMRCTCRRNFEGALIKVNPNCPLVQAAHR